MTASATEARLFTVGHSNYEFETLLSLLQQHRITAVADVRSSPYSRYCPQFNRDLMSDRLEASKIRYVYLGHELGARRDEPECYEGMTARYDLIAASPLFRRGLGRVRQGVAWFTVALLCAEKDPLTCHRSILVCRHLRADGPIYHIGKGGELETHAEAETRLLALCGLPSRDLFREREEMVEWAYEIQGDRLAYRALPETEVG